MLNFTVGPVQANESIRKIGYEQVPYFRTPEFSKTMLENEELIKKFAKAPEDSRVVFLTGSGTSAMEATIMNVFNKNDKVLIVNGGSFGQRFVDLCTIHEIPYSEIKLEFGMPLTKEKLAEYEGEEYTGFLVNMHETSSGVCYDMDMISEFCVRNSLFLVIDAISSFLADRFSMNALNAGVVITGSQKALACPPGISIIVLSETAQRRIENNCVKSMYFDLKSALKNGERGQTPFTPAVGILLQINRRLHEIESSGGVDVEIERVAELAKDFREKITNLPLKYVSNHMSNAVTALYTSEISANKVFSILKDDYQIWVCPNGGIYADTVFRVGHIGNLTKMDNTILVEALSDIYKRGVGGL